MFFGFQTWTVKILTDDMKMKLPVIEKKVRSKKTKNTKLLVKTNLTIFFRVDSISKLKSVSHHENPQTIAEK